MTLSINRPFDYKLYNVIIKIYGQCSETLRNGRISNDPVSR